MNTVEPRLRRSYYIRQAVLGVLCGGIGLVILLCGGRRLGWLGRLAGIMGFATWGVITLREFFRGAKRLDSSGATRRDGRFFPWADLKKKRFIYRRLPGGGPGPLNHVDLIFLSGKVRIFPFTIENVADVMQFIGAIGSAPQE